MTKIRALHALMSEPSAGRGGAPMTFSTLVVLEACEGQATAAEICKATGITAAGITGLLDSMEDRGLVRRAARPARGEGDRRSVKIERLPGGTELLERVNKVLYP